MVTQKDTPNVEASGQPPQHRRKVALISGVQGQDGSYLTQFLLDKGYEVHGLIRRSANISTRRVDHIYIGPYSVRKALAQVKLHYADITDAPSLRRLIDTISPDEVYNLADQYDVALSFENPVYPADLVATVAYRLLEAVRSHVCATGRSHIRFFQAGSSDIFGKPTEEHELGWCGGCVRLGWGKAWEPPSMSETSPFKPQTPYAAARCAAHWCARHYREAYGLFVCNGILFNHDSPRRCENYVSRQITRAAARIKIGLQKRLFLADLSSFQDWGFAGDHVEAMWMMLQQEKPDDYVVTTEEPHYVADFCAAAFEHVGLAWGHRVYVNDGSFRQTEFDNRLGDASKAKKVLGWKPKVGFKELAKMMVDEDSELAKREKVLLDTGYLNVSIPVVLAEAKCRRSRMKRLGRSRSARLGRRHPWDFSETEL